MTLEEIIVDFLSLEKKEIESSPVTLRLLKKLLKKAGGKECIDNVEKYFLKIFEDKKIDMKDLPELICLFQELLVLYDTLRLNVATIETSKVFNTLVKLMVEYKLSNSDKLSDEEKTKLSDSVNTLTDLCVQMIDLRETQKKMKKWCKVLPCY